MHCCVQSPEGTKYCSHGREPTSLCLLPSPLFRGEGLGVRGFALCFDWIFDREFNA